ncbi:hypothetical protein VOLCADRAFT_108682, partial [Volvox carteri f. nagariensis]
MTLKVGIIGAGSVGQTLGKAIAKKHSVLFGVRNVAKYADLAGLENVSVLTVPEAVKSSDVVVLAVPGAHSDAGIKAIASDLGADIKGKVLIDATNPLSPYPGLEVRWTGKSGLYLQPPPPGLLEEAACRFLHPTQRGIASTASKMVAQLYTKVCIIGSGPAAHTAAIYTARAELGPILFEGFMANGNAAGGFSEGILGVELTNCFRDQSARFGTKIFSETVENVDFSKRPFTVRTSEKEVKAETVIIATGAVAKRMEFPGSGEEGGYWNKGISACAVCDGAALIFRNKPIAVIGGGDSAMEEANFLTKYGS